MFNYTFDTNITKEFLLSKNNEETYMSYYLGVPVKKGLFKSSLRVDSHNTCSFFRGKSGTLYFKDFATGDCLDFVNVVMKKFLVTYHQALKIIANDFGLISGTIPKFAKIQPHFKEEKQTFIQCEVKEFAKHELKWWNSFGITPKLLNKYRVYSIKTVFLNGNIFAQSSQHCPIYGYYMGKKENVEQWRIYMPMKKEFRFIGNVSTKTIQGYQQIPKSGKVLVITKSMKDCMTFASLGIPAIAPNSETQFINNKILSELRQRFKHIILIFDNDLVGVKFTNKIRKQHAWLKYTILPRNTGAKDISDYYKMYGREKTIDLIKNYVERIK